MVNGMTDHAHNDEWRAKVNRRAIAIVIAVFVVIVFVGCVAGSANSGNRNDEQEAIAQCEARIEKLLKSPATADFDSAASARGSERWAVTGTVDAENSFGATVRASYGCTVVMNDNSTVTTKVDYFDQ